VHWLRYPSEYLYVKFVAAKWHWLRYPSEYSVFSCLLQALLHLHDVCLVTASFLKVCHRSDPKLDECVMDSVQGLRSHLVTGK